jgi:L-rhamnose mutarotase
MQRRSQSWQATLISFLGLCGLAHADLKDDWQHLNERQSFWASRNRNVGALEDYMMRHYDTEHPSRAHMIELIQQSQISNYNLYLEQTHEVFRHPTFIHQAEMIGDNINSYLNHVPKIDITSYQWLSVPFEAVNRYEVGMGVYQEGFLQSMASLYDIQNFMFNNPANLTRANVVLEIQGSSGRLLRHLLPGETSPVLFPKKTFFVVQSINQDATTQIHLMQIKEISLSEAKQLPRIVRMSDNSPFDPHCL